MDTLIDHQISASDPLLGSGWYPSEPALRGRWAGQVFSLNLESPLDRGPYACHLKISCWYRDADAPGGANFYVNRVRVGRVENAYQLAARNQPLAITFWTFGGPLEVTVVFDSAMPPSDPKDLRSLSVIVTSFTLACAR